ncbi:MAG: phytanoyl-CoA dioxygenase family protein [Betaproteobacteria bacterium]|nr:phytanoyl-CoA dioxygenase family protein [Betaproteobacteria bacterium]
MKLTQEAVDRFRRDGFLFPIRVMSETQAAALRGKLEAFERAQGHPLSGDQRHKTHLLFAWLSDLIREEGILDPVESLYGPNLLCWATNFFVKEARTPDFVSWHQDSTYWGLSSPDVVTAWIALTHSNASNGAMEVIPGTHLMDQVPHRDTYAKHNLLTRGQEVMVDVDPAKAVRLDLEAGEMSLHHVRLIHGSPPNPSDDRRIGIAVRLIPTSVRQIHGEDSATLVRGVDEIRSFEPEPRPRADLEPDLVAFHKRVAERNARILYKGTQIGSYNDEAALPGVRASVG